MLMSRITIKAQLKQPQRGPRETQFYNVGWYPAAPWRAAASRKAVCACS